MRVGATEFNTTEAAQMNMECRISRAEIDYDLALTKSQMMASSAAVEQMQAVEEAARRIMAGNTIIDTRKRYNGAQVVGEIQVAFGKQHVADLFSEKVTEELITGIYQGTPKGLHQAQKLIGDCACEVAFDALNLWGSPFTDYADLKDEWEQSK